MPKNATVSCPAGTPTQLTDLAVSVARVVGSQDIHLCATLDTTPPTSTAGSVMLLPWSVLTADLALVDLFPGVGASVYLWAWPLSGAVDVSVSHA
mgnify:CR=1 FL=1